MNIDRNKYISDKQLFQNRNNRYLVQLRVSMKKLLVRELCKAEKEAKYDVILRTICERMSIIVDDCRFVYNIDFKCIPDNNRGVVFDNLSVDYRKILQSGLIKLKYPQGECTNKYCESHNNVIDSLIILAERIVVKLEKKKSLNYQKKIEWFKNIINKEAVSFEEAVQRVLFVNQVLWQTNHPLMGFGLLDSMLEPYYEKDKSSGLINEDNAISIIMDFYTTLHKYYWYKSHALMGDTGQLIIVGKTDYDGAYHCSDLTYYLIKALKNVHLPDPKVLMRVSSRTPADLIETALDCIATGIGAPIFANDDIIIPKLIEFGTDEKDAYDYATSACWEPLIAWNCPISNNLTVLNFMKALDNLLKREPLTSVTSFSELMDRYYFYLERNLNAAKRSLEGRRFAYDPLVSAFIDDCYSNKKDVSEGGAKYNDYGMTSIALGNVVNAMLNIKKLVFDTGKLTLTDVKKALILNFDQQEELAAILKVQKKKYGCDDEEVIELSNDIIRHASIYTRDFVNYMGGRLKFGLSSPAYVDQARWSAASFDGRKKGDPFYVHISTDSSEAYTELVNFASKLDYGENRFNGNVVDYIVTPGFILDNFKKFTDFLMASINTGFFEMQINVVSSDILIQAKKDKNAFPNLIVRVWGFSAYFNDLPEEYKDVIIERALRNEGKSA